MLPDDILLEIFHFYVYVRRYLGTLSKGKEKEVWIKLAHVCRQWRSVVFQSPRRLDLRLVCTADTPVTDALDIWPPFPLIIYTYGKTSLSLNNVVAALEHNGRVREIQLHYFTTYEMGYVTDSAAMQKPFPELTGLSLSVDIHADDRSEPKLPDSFLGGIAPRLHSIFLGGMSFPGLLKLLLSATHLVDLRLHRIPVSGYIPPEAMATCLSALTSLESLLLHFRHPRPRPSLETRRLSPPPLSRSILPSLTKIDFDGTSEYLEVILARIDAPRLDQLDISFFNQIIFNTPQLFHFINRRPKLRAPEMGYIEFCRWSVKFRSQTSNHSVLSLRIQCSVSEWQLSSLAQVCTSSLPPLSTLEDLYILEDQAFSPDWQDDVENTLWLELLHPFAAVKNLYVVEELVPRIAPALQELVGGRSTEILPTLENIFLEDFQPSGPLHEGIEKFVAARLLTSHPVAVSHWDGSV
jgi:hypothetical protein